MTIFKIAPALPFYLNVPEELARAGISLLQYGFAQFLAGSVIGEFQLFAIRRFDSLRQVKVIVGDGQVFMRVSTTPPKQKAPL